ncbi:hypothetical protein H6P81_003638 [Aristolochia fimbriata]|uniref:DUF4005 domain-containing protein n=1 Tax=Aristolochia fimbriata TaxID=158543 RepID=A0AAV7FG48_ARIFI|nr:hypothetical protein H6P81_003638 [Aristolochia fimbriata]
MKKKLGSNSWLPALIKKTFSTSKLHDSSFSSQPQPPKMSDEKSSIRIIDSAATKIQTAFRGYLAKRALKSLKALVRLQALVRGFYIRRRTQVTLRCLFSLLRIQGRARRRRRFITETALLPLMSAGKIIAACRSKVDQKEDNTKTSEYSRSTTEVLLENYIDRNGEKGKISGRSNRSSGSVSDQPGGGIGSSSPYRPKIEKDLLSFKTEELNRSRAVPPRKHMNCRDSSLRYQSPSSSFKTPTITKPRYQNPSRVQISPPAAPNYMAFTQSAKARAHNRRVCSGLQEGSFLPPIRTRRSSFPLVESDFAESTPSSVGECGRRRREWRGAYE